VRPSGTLREESGITPPDSRVNIFTTTTDTDLLTQVYDLVGVPAATVPEPPAWTLLGAGLLALGFIIRQRIKDRAHPPS
jgi:hypothetical protein